MSLFDFLSPGAQLAQNLKQLEQNPNALLLDVRTQEEYVSGHLPGAVNLPLDRLNEIDLDKERPVYAYCRSGARSAQACTLLRKLGYQAFNLGGVLGYHGPLE